MLAVFTPPPRRIKQEVKTEPMGPDTPWAMQAVTTRTGTPTLLRVEPVHGRARAPWVKEERQPNWEKEERQPDQPNWVKEERQPNQPAVNPYPHAAKHPLPRWDQRPGQESESTHFTAAQPSKPNPPVKHVSSRNYAAVEAGLERFGLIDEGKRSGGRALLVHVRKRCRPAFQLLNAVRAGAVLQVKRSSRTASLRVRSITPARYYSPGSLVTTLEILVDEADWRSLAPGI